MHFINFYYNQLLKTHISCNLEKKVAAFGQYRVPIPSLHRTIPAKQSSTGPYVDRRRAALHGAPISNAWQRELALTGINKRFIGRLMLLT